MIDNWEPGTELSVNNLVGEIIPLELTCQTCGKLSKFHIRWTGKNFEILGKQPNDLEKTLLEVFKKYNLLPE